MEDCLERVLGPTATIPCDFALVFYEGHDGAQVQKGLDAFAARYVRYIDTFGLLGIGWEEFVGENRVGCSSHNVHAWSVATHEKSKLLDQGLKLTKVFSSGN